MSSSSSSSSPAPDPAAAPAPPTKKQKIEQRNEENDDDVLEQSKGNGKGSSSNGGGGGDADADAVAAAAAAPAPAPAAAAAAVPAAIPPPPAAEAAATAAAEQKLLCLVCGKKPGRLSPPNKAYMNTLDHYRMCVRQHVRNINETATSENRPRDILSGYLVEMTSPDGRYADARRGRHYYMYAIAGRLATFDQLGRFMISKWLRCCGHLSKFTDDDQTIVPRATLLADYDVDDHFSYEYDFGSTTEVNVTIVGDIHPPGAGAGGDGGASSSSSQNGANDQIRLVVRNAPLDTTHNSPRVGVGCYGGDSSDDMDDDDYRFGMYHEGEDF